MKNQVEFTAYALETWVAVLSVFEPYIVNRAVIQLGLGVDPFPDLGKVVMICEELRRKATGKMPSDGKVKLADATLNSVAKALQLPIGEDRTLSKSTDGGGGRK
jgi:hypothetical protein